MSNQIFLQSPSYGFNFRQFRHTLIITAGDASGGPPNGAQDIGSEHHLGGYARQDPQIKIIFLIIIVVVFSIFTFPTLSWSLKDQIREYWPIFGNVYLDDRLKYAFSFINQNFPPKTNTLSTFYTGNYLPAYTKTVSFIGHFGYTYNMQEKEKLVLKFFENKMTDEQAKTLIKNNKITLIFQGPEEKPIYKDYLYPKLLKPVYDREEVTLYVLK